MTCKFAQYQGMKPICKKGYPIQLLKCMRGELLCYQERNEEKKKVEKE